MKFNACDGTAIAGTVSSWGSSSIAVQVPSSAVTGPVCVIVNGQASNTASLTVQTGPVIAAVSPRWGPVSTPITLTGVNFGAPPGTVNWDGNPVGYTEWANDHVTLTVPTGAATGHLTVVRNGVSSNGVAFEVGDEGREYYHTDGIGSVRMITGYDGDVLERHDYLPFCEEWPPRPDQAHIGFGGKEKDQETGNGSWMALSYSGARSLQTAMGRFTVPDAPGSDQHLEDPQTWNLYTFVRNNPLSNVDPDGKACFSLTSQSDFCERATSYGRTDAKLRDRTRFFAAASAVSQALADTTILGTPISFETRSFLAQTGRDLEVFNAVVAVSVTDGTLSGNDLDARIVHMEQSRIQGSLDSLKKRDPSAYAKVIADSNNLLNGGVSSTIVSYFGLSTDRAYERVLAQLRKRLGRDLDFENQQDREAIGNALIDHIRTTGGCDIGGSRLEGC